MRNGLSLEFTYRNISHVTQDQIIERIHTHLIRETLILKKKKFTHE